MATFTLKPTSDAGPNEWTGTSPHWSRLDEDLASPDGLDIQAQKNDDGARDVFDMGTNSLESGTASQVVLRMAALTDDALKQPTANVHIATGSLGATVCAWAISKTVTEITWSGLSLTQADIDALKTEFIANGSISTGDTHFLDAFELVITYEPGVSKMHIIDVDKDKDQIYIS